MCSKPSHRHRSFCRSFGLTLPTVVWLVCCGAPSRQAGLGPDQPAYGPAANGQGTGDSVSSLIAPPLGGLYLVETLGDQAFVVLGEAGEGLLFQPVPYEDNLVGYTERELEEVQELVAMSQAGEDVEVYEEEYELLRCAANPLYRSFLHVGVEDAWMGAWREDMARFTLGFDIAPDLADLAVSPEVLATEWQVLDVDAEVCRGVLGPPVVLSLIRPHWGRGEAYSRRYPGWQDHPASIPAEEWHHFLTLGNLYVAAPVTECTVLPSPRALWARPRTASPPRSASMVPLDETDPRVAPLAAMTTEIPAWQEGAARVRETYASEDPDRQPELAFEVYATDGPIELAGPGRAGDDTATERVVYVVYTTLGHYFCGEGVAQESMASVWTSAAPGAGVDPTALGEPELAGTIPVYNLGVTPLMAGDVDADGALDLLIQHDAWTGGTVFYESLGQELSPVASVWQANLDSCD